MRLVLLLHVIIASCLPSAFNASSKKTTSSAPSAVATATPSIPVHPSSPAAPFQPCPNTTQNILVLDFKSGWWAGDAGKFFQLLVHGLVQACSGKVKIEYHHILQALNEGALFQGTALELTEFNAVKFDQAFFEKDWNNFHQIWVLSGSSEDDLDMRLNNTLYGQIANAIKNSKANLYIATGNGNFTHSNDLAQRLIGSAVFQPLVGTNGVVVDATQAITVISTTGADKFVVPSHWIFSNLQTIADQVRVAAPYAKIASPGYLLESDSIVHPQLTPLLKSSKNNLVMAEFKLGNRQMIFDGGVQRFYAMRDSNQVQAGQETMRLLQNILSYLSQNF